MKKKVFIFSSVIFLLTNVTAFTLPRPALAASSCSQTNWYNDSWVYRKRIVFNNSSQAENLVNFPVLIKVNSSRIEYGKTQNSGQDIRFTDSDGTTLLSHEIEKWDESGDSFVWVKVPQIDASSSTDFIYMYYGNAGAPDSQSPTSVWDANYVGVWHLKESTISLLDSTSNAVTSTKRSATEPIALDNAQINGGQTFDGIDDHALATNPSIDDFGTGPMTISAWAKTTQSTDQEQIVDNKVAGTNLPGFNLQMLASGAPYFRIANGSSQISVTATSTINNGLWHQVVGVRDITNDRRYIYIDGQDKNNLPGANPTWDISSSRELFFGAYQAPTTVNHFTGDIDEIRLSNIARSPAWIAAEYKTGTDIFNTYANEEGFVAECPAAAPPICGATEPTLAPAITSISPGLSSATLNFSFSGDHLNHYALEFGTKSGEYIYGAHNIGGKEATNYTVNLFAPGTRYYFRVRAGNDCAVGPWSSEVSAATLNNITLPPIQKTPTPSPTPLPTPKPIAVPSTTQSPFPVATPSSEPAQAKKINFDVSVNISSLLSPLSNFGKKVYNNIFQTVGSTTTFASESITYAGFILSENYTKQSNLLEKVSSWLAYTRTSFEEMVLDNEPTQISDVDIENLTRNSVRVIWKTNHLSTSKINYGESLVYGKSIQSSEKVHEHSLEITDLKPETKYFFEVMSQNKIYVYDAHHEFITPPEN